MTSGDRYRSCLPLPHEVGAPLLKGPLWYWLHTPGWQPLRRAKTTRAIASALVEEGAPLLYTLAVVLVHTPGL